MNVDISYDGLIRLLRYCASIDLLCKKNENCPFYCRAEEVPHCVERMMKKSADAIEELYKAARNMHLWIFLNSSDEQASYKECKLSDEMNEKLGYSGSYCYSVKDEIAEESDHVTSG